MNGGYTYSQEILQ